MDQLGYGILTIGILFIIAAMFSLGRSRTRRASGSETARDHVDRARQKQGVRDELEALMVDINRMAKDLGGQLDAKIVRIEQAVREADERIAQLDALRDSMSHPAEYQQGQASEQGDPFADHLGDQLVTPQAPADQTDPLTREVYALADQGIGPVDIADRLDEHIGKVELILALRTG